jgi:hypothetical protein
MRMWVQLNCSDTQFAGGRARSENKAAGLHYIALLLLF